MTDRFPDSPDPAKPDDLVLNPANLDAERHALELKFGDLLVADDTGSLRELAMGLNPGDLSEVLRPMNVEDTARILRMLPPDPLAEVLSEIDNRSLSALFTLLDIDEIADIIEEMPSDEAADVIGELDTEQAAEILAAMEEEERSEVADLLRYPPESAGGIMGKEFAACSVEQTAGQAVAVLRELDEDDLEETHFIYVLDSSGILVGRLPLFRLLITAPETAVGDIMEADPLYVEVDLDQEEVAGFFQTHDLVSLPVVDRGREMVGLITADDVMDVMEDEATEDMARLAGVSKEEFGEQSSFRVARSRLPWLLGAMLGQFGAVLVMSHYEQSIETMVALALYIPMIMGTAGNIGIQTSSVVVRGLATGEVDFYHLGRHLGRELGTAILTGAAVAAFIYLISWMISSDPNLSAVLSLAMLLVVLFAAMAGSGIPLLLHRVGIDPAVATGPFITTANDIVSMV
ncbi:MAG: magnesium transporter, partial [Candidatus Krumholzibacteriota bacterium]